MAEAGRTPSRLLALLVPFALLVPSTAHAEKVVVDDAVGDVEKANWEQETVDAPVLVPAPEETSSDIVRTVAAYGDNRLQITVKYQDLLTLNDLSAYVRIHSPHQRPFDLSLDKEKGSAAEVSLGSPTGDVECPGLRGSLERATDLVAFSVPTSCLGRPRWVQLGVSTVRTSWPPADQDQMDFDIFVDDGNRPTVNREKLAKGPRIHRG